MHLSSAQLRRAATLQEKIESMQKELAQLLGSQAPATVAGKVKKKRTMSASARKKIAAAQKARWARQKSGTTDKKAK